MKTFIAYRHTGEKTEYLQELLTAAKEALGQAGIKAYCTFFDEASFKDKSLDARQIMQHAFSIIDKSDFLFVLQTSENKSEGMLMEVGYCIAKNIPIIVAVKEGVEQTYLPDMASASFKWADLKDLATQIEHVHFSGLTRV